MSQDTTTFFRCYLKKLICILTHLKPCPYCITKHKEDDASKIFVHHSYVVLTTSRQQLLIFL